MTRRMQVHSLQLTTTVVAIHPRIQLLPPCTRTLRNLRLRLTTVLWILSTNQKATRLEKKPAPKQRLLAARIARAAISATRKRRRLLKASTLDTSWIAIAISARRRLLLKSAPTTARVATSAQALRRLPLTLL